MEILIIVFLILLNGIFSMSEVALISSRRFTLESAAKKGNANARKALDLAASPNTFLSTVQIGITLIGILTGIFSGAKLTDDLQLFLNSVPILQPYSESLAVVLVVIILTYFSIVFGELLPKRIGLTFPEKIASLVAVPMNYLSMAAKPFVWLLSATNDSILRLFNIQDRTDGVVSEEEIKSIIASSTISGEIQEIEEQIVKRVFALGDRKAGELMTHKSDLHWIDISDDLDAIHAKVGQNPYQYYPVSDGSTDKLLGLVSVNQIFRNSYRAEKFDLSELIQKAVYVQENMAAYRVLEKFQESKVHLVVVVDEYGSVQGVLSIRDLVGALIGDNFMNEMQGYIVKRDDDSWIADGQCPYFEFVRYLKLSDLKDADGFTTIAGLILNELNNFPEVGQKIRWESFEFEILEMAEMRIEKIIIRKLF